MEKKHRTPAVERRNTTRVDCCYQVECGHPQGSFRASVVNMGLGGMRLLCNQELQAEDCLSLRQADMGSLSVRVVWCRARTSGDNFECGVVYSDSLEQLENSWVKGALRRLGFEAKSLYERRRTLRARTSVDADLSLAGKVYSCTILDLGLGGALVETARPILGIQDGAPVNLAVRIEGAEPLAAQIVYTRHLDGGQQLGLCFDADRLTQAQARLVEGYLQARG
jgi:hypothetical protein